MISNTDKSLQTFKKALLEIDSGRRDCSPYHFTMADVLARTFLIYRFIVTTPTTISSRCLISLVNALINIFSAFVFSRGFAARVFGLRPKTCRPVADEAPRRTLITAVHCGHSLIRNKELLYVGITTLRYLSSLWWIESGVMWQVSKNLKMFPIKH